MGRIGCRNEGRKAWRVMLNPHHNDFNDEPERIIVPYTVIGESKAGKAYLACRSGWGTGRKNQRYVPKRELFFRKEDAEKALEALSQESGVYND